MSHLGIHTLNEWIILKTRLNQLLTWSIWQLEEYFKIQLIKSKRSLDRQIPINHQVHTWPKVGYRIHSTQPTCKARKSWLTKKKKNYLRLHNLRPQTLQIQPRFFSIRVPHDLSLSLNYSHALTRWWWWWWWWTPLQHLILHEPVVAKLAPDMSITLSTHLLHSIKWFHNR